MAKFRQTRSEGRWDSQTWSLTLGWLFGIRIRAHFLLMSMAAFFLLRSIGENGFAFAMRYELPFQAIAWLSILLHELGHCFGCRSVGGSANDVLLWPLGGLAFCDAPRNPRANLITVLAGPGVNLAICAVTYPLLVYLGAHPLSLLNPLTHPALAFVNAIPLPVWMLGMTFKINLALLLFNMLLPIFPFDLGRTIQNLLWMRVGYYPSMVIATNLGIVASIVLAGLGLYLAGAWGGDYFMLTAIAFFGFFQSIQTRRELEMNVAMNDNEFGYDFSAGYTSLEGEGAVTSDSPRKVSLSPSAAVRGWLARRRQKKEAKVEEELDRILDKIHATGMDSLTRAEKKILQLASDKRRRRE